MTVSGTHPRPRLRRSADCENRLPWRARGATIFAGECQRATRRSYFRRNYGARCEPSCAVIDSSFALRERAPVVRSPRLRCLLPRPSLRCVMVDARSVHTCAAGPRLSEHRAERPQPRRRRRPRRASLPRTRSRARTRRPPSRARASTRAPTCRCTGTSPRHTPLRRATESPVPRVGCRRRCQVSGRRAERLPPRAVGRARPLRPRSPLRTERFGPKDRCRPRGRHDTDRGGETPSKPRPRRRRSAPNPRDNRLPGTRAIHPQPSFSDPRRSPSSLAMRSGTRAGSRREAGTRSPGPRPAGGREASLCRSGR
jgi:hypothetical protein